MMESKGNVLVIDDDPLLLMNYADLLEDNNYTVSEASSYIQGMNRVKSRDFDLIICDHDLGDGKGIEIVKWLIYQEKEMPVVYLSGAQLSVLNEVRDLSIVCEALAKPVSENKILDLVQRYIKVVDEDKFPRLIGDDERNQLLNNLIFNDDDVE